MTYQIIINLGISPHIKAAQGNPVGGKGSQKLAKIWKDPLFPLLVELQEPRTTQHTIYERT